MIEESNRLREEERTGILKGLITIDFSYVLDTWLGRVKFLELIFVTLAGCLLPSVIGVFFTRYSFYTFVVWTSFMYITVDLLLHVTSLWRRLPALITSSAILIYPVLMAALAFLVSSSLVVSVSANLYGSRSNRSGISSGCGFITMVLFFIEAFLHYRNQGTEKREEVHEDDHGKRTISMPISRGLENPPPYSNNDSTTHQVTPVGSYGGNFV